MSLHTERSDEAWTAKVARAGLRRVNEIPRDGIATGVTGALTVAPGVEPMANLINTGVSSPPERDELAMSRASPDESFHC